MGEVPEAERHIVLKELSQKEFLWNIRGDIMRAQGKPQQYDSCSLKFEGKSKLVPLTLGYKWYQQIMHV